MNHLRLVSLTLLLTASACTTMSGPSAGQGASPSDRDAVAAPDVAPDMAMHALASAAARSAASAPATPLFGSGSGATGTDTAATDAAKAKESDARQPRIFRGNDQVVAPPSGPAARPITGKPASFHFEDAPIAEVTNVILGEIAKVDFVFHGQITGSVTMATREPVSPDQAVYLLETALQANGLVMARDSRGTYHIGKPEALKGIVAAPRQAAGGTLPAGYGAVIVPLKYIGANEMAAILRPIAGGDALVRVDAVRNLLVMVGTRAQAEGWLDIVHTFDIDLLKGMSVGVFPLKYASVAEVQAALQVMSGGAAPSAAAALPGRPGAPASASTSAPGGAGASAAGASALGESNPLFGALRIMPLERINSILVVTPRAEYLDQARQWIERLDKPNTSSTEPQLQVYNVQNGNARHLAEVLTSIFGGGGNGGNASGGNGIAPGLGASNGFSNGFGNNGGGISYSGFGGSGGFGNSGSFGGGGFGSSTGSFGGGFGSSGGMGGGFGGGFGNRSGFGNGSNGNQQGARQGGVAAANLASNIRIVADDANNALLVYAPPADFVNIEETLKRLDVRAAQVLIEASIIEVTLSDELKYGLEWYFKNGAGRFAGAGTLGAPTADAAVGAAAGGLSYTIAKSATDIRAVLNALANKSLIKVISSPSLMVLDNQTANIQVGDQVPVQTGTTITSGVGVTTSIQYKDTGVQLEVTPSVNAGNIVTMQLTQAVTDVGTADATGNLPFKQRLINSKVAVRSGQSLVLGGLIQDNTTNGRAGIPFLQDLPLVGAAFGARTVKKARTELVVILTPRVVRSDEDIRDLGSDMRERLHNIFPDNRPRGYDGRVRQSSTEEVIRNSPGASGLPPASQVIRVPN